MRLLFAALFALMLAACNQAAEKTEQPDASAQVAENGCPAAASGTWQGMQIEASANGADCATAQATLSIGSNGATLWSETYPANQVMVLAGAESVEDMQRRLNEWVNPPGAARDSTGDLPVWAAGARSPMSGEFPFYVEEGVDRARYEGLRGRDAPMFCYVQGMESEACLAFENGRVTKIGVQSFPG
ncbi:MAG TPA: hypothetical protein VJ748_00160 [Vitreimonas sp.]|jgi:hypothetical protein|nr:hypothetical protein [Vitreimonas sp.]